MSLYHSHILQLAEEGTVTYNQGQELIALTERDEQLASIQNQLMR